MTYNVKITTTKPEGVVWFVEVDPTAVSRINAWQESFPGYLSCQIISSTANSGVKVYEWQDEASYDAYKVACGSNQDEIDRSAYNQANGIVSVVEII